MSEFSEMFERVKLGNIVEFLMYGTKDYDKEKTEAYQSRIDHAFETIFETLERMYPSASRHNNELLGAVMDFSATNNEVYLEMGLIIGFQIYKTLEQNYQKVGAADIQSIIKKQLASGRYMEKTE